MPVRSLYLIYAIKGEGSKMAALGVFSKLERSVEVKISYHYDSGIGGRSTNEDCVGVNEWKNGAIFAVADGMGKMPYGALASKIAVETILRMGEREKPSKSFTRQMYQLAERMLQKTTEMEKFESGMLKTTLSTLQIDLTEECFYLGHQGDCRVYVFRGEECFVKTKDHSIAQKLVSQGKLTESSMRQAAERMQITRILGAGMERACEATEAYALMGNMAFLLCTDGFWSAIEESEMARLLRESATPKEWIEKMEEQVIRNGSSQKIFDNYSSIAVLVTE